MVLFNHATREMTAKIVYYGPGLCGKTTNLMVIFDKLDPNQKGKMLSLATKTDRTLFFDLLPVDIGKVGAFNLKIQLYTVPGQVFYNETRKLVLKGADAVVFVADSQPAMVEATRESFANLMENLQENNIDPNDTPIVIQYNKRDLPGVLPVEDLQDKLGFEGYPYTEASALKGDGVMETFRLVSKITAKHLYGRLKGKSGVMEPIVEKKRSERAPSAVRPKLDIKPEPAAAAPPEPVAEAKAPEINPFADSVPFPESSPYERMEEVSLEQLLSEGRERPATLHGTVPVPIEDVEELDATALVEEAPVAVEEPPPAPEPAAGPSLEIRVRELEEQIESMRAEHRADIERILRGLDDLTSSIRSRM
ncbi:MAG TPA: GTPase domain-containing protein [Thermoanaerobaculia bacterium]|nr:GTPase domain-containing protein [Thermoanaerobaculia bacterium]